MDTLTIPCSDCEDTSRRLRMRDFRVLGCDPDPANPGFCTISFERVAAVVPASVPVTAAPEASLTPTQAATAKAIVNLFETGSLLGDYGQVTLLPGDTGRLTYGRSQTTLGSGGLATLLQRYCANPGARFGPRLRRELPRIADRSAAVDTDTRLHNVLRAAADDPVMREVQDAFFDERYWQPALAAARRHDLVSPLAVAVVYDSVVHGSLKTVAAQVVQRHGKPGAIGEEAWVAHYVATRREWLATHDNEALHATVYRMDAFQRLIEQGLWGLPLPLVVRGQEISATTLAGQPPGCFDGPQPGTRAVAFGEPLMRGLDVRLLQLGLSERGMKLRADGVFGRASADALRTFQIATGRPVTGAADAATVAELGTLPV